MPYKHHSWKPDKDFSYVCKRCNTTRVAVTRNIYTTPDGKKHYTAPPCIPVGEYAIPSYGTREIKQIAKIWAAKHLSDAVDNMPLHTELMSGADLEQLRNEMHYAVFLILRGFDPFQRSLKLNTLDEVIRHVTDQVIINHKQNV